jgi:hypothetical protein
MAASMLDVDVKDPALARGVAHLYSGGADSSLAACRLAQVFPEVHLNTFDRFGFLVASKFPATHFERLRQRFPQTRFTHRVIPATRFYDEVESWRYWPSLRRHGLLVLNTCGHCKVALHWRNLVFCLQNGVRYASDGAVMNAEEFAEQNPRILMGELEGLYARFGIKLLHPAYEEGLSTEDELHDLGITEQRRIKMTTKDFQVVCTQHVLFGMMMRVILARMTFPEYEAAARAYLHEKLEHIKEATSEFLARPGEDTLVARLLG